MLGLFCKRAPQKICNRSQYMYIYLQLFATESHVQHLLHRLLHPVLAHTPLPLQLPEISKSQLAVGIRIRIYILLKLLCCICTHLKLLCRIFCTASSTSFRTYPKPPMGWLRFLGSLKSYVSFAKEPHKRDDILQKRPVILRSLQIVATP